MPILGLASSHAAGLLGTDVHIQTRYLGPAGVSLHPLQRAGLVAAASHDFIGRMRALGRPGLGDAPAAANTGLGNFAAPPIVPIAGTARDTGFLV